MNLFGKLIVTWVVGGEAALLLLMALTLWRPAVFGAVLQVGLGVWLGPLALALGVAILSDMWRA